MNIFLRELKANLKSLIIWSVIIALLIVVACSKFTAYAGNPEMLKILDAFPPAVLDAFSMRGFDLTTITGFYGIMFVYFALMGGIAASMWGSDMISKEERDKTVEFSLVLPVSRPRVVTAKALAALVDCILLLLVSWGVSLAAVQQFHPDQAFYSFLTLEMEALFIIELVFLAVGLLLGCGMKRYKLSASTAVGIILVTYFLSVIASLQQDLEWLKWFTPFKWFDSFALLNDGHLGLSYLVLALGVIVVCVAAAYLTYQRRDLYI